MNEPKNEGQARPLGRPVGMPPRVLIHSALQEQPRQEWKPTGTETPQEDLKEFPVWGLPKDLQTVIETVADGYRCSPSIPAAAIFSAAGTAIGKTVKGKFGNYVNYPANWFVIVGKASSGKTGAGEWVYKPLMDYEEKSYMDYCTARDEYNQQPKDQRGEPPRRQSRIEGLMTDEKLLHKLAENGGALCWKHGELEALFGGMGRYNKGGAGMIIGCLEDIFSHTTLQRDTLSGNTIFVKEPALNIFSTTQPIKLKQLMAQYVKGRGGYFERFLFVHVEKRKGCKEPGIIDDDVRRVWHEHIDRLLRLEHFEMTENAQAQELHRAAVERWEERGDTLDENGSDDDFDDVKSSIYYKANYHLCRMAMTAAVLNGDRIISAPVIRYAIDVTNYLVANQLYFLNVVVRDDRQRGQSVGMKEVCQYLVQRGKRQIEIANFLGVERQTVHGYLKTD